MNRQGPAAPRFVTAVAIAAVVVAVGGCATHQPTRSLTDRFVRPATEPVPELLPDLSEAREQQAPEETAPIDVLPGPRPLASSLATIEQFDRRLAEALEGLDAPPDAAAHRRVAIEYRRLLVLDRAHTHLSAAIDISPRDAIAYDLRARVWRDWGQPGLGLSDASRALYYAPDWAVAHNTLGTLLVAVGQVEEAEQRFEMALALDPDAAYLWSNLCYVALMRGDAGRARTRCDESLARSPGLTAARNNRALVAAAEGQLVAARRDFDVAGAAAGEFNIGLVHLSRGEYAEAADAFEAAAARLPASAVALRRALDARRRAEAGSGRVKER